MTPEELAAVRERDALDYAVLRSAFKDNVTEMVPPALVSMNDRHRLLAYVDALEEAAAYRVQIWDRNTRNLVGAYPTLKEGRAILGEMAIPSLSLSVDIGDEIAVVCPDLNVHWSAHLSAPTGRTG